MISLTHPIVEEDIRGILEADLDWRSLYGKTVLVTGATGMLASYFCFVLVGLNRYFDAGITIIALARDQEKLKVAFGETPDMFGVHYLVQDVCDDLAWADTVDYVFHAAGAASARAIVENPVGIINANVLGTRNVLELARSRGTQRVLFASTREVYGAVLDKDSITESDMGSLDPLDPRSCYPESKRAAESLLMAYANQYRVPFNVARIAHSYGPGMAIADDGRVMADFMNDAVNGRDIHLNSTGEAERAFCYVADAVEGLFRILLMGESNTAYNIANEFGAIRVVDLASKLQLIANTGKGVTIEGKNNNAGYTNYRRIPLCVDRLTKLGWEGHTSLDVGLARTLSSLRLVSEIER